MDGYPTGALRRRLFSECLLEPSRSDGTTIQLSLTQARPRRNRPPKKEQPEGEDEDEDEIEELARQRMAESFMEAVMMNDEDEELQDLIDGGAVVDGPDWLGRTALIIAATEGLTEVVNILLENDAEADAVDQRGRSALIWASGNGSAEAVEALLAKGVELDRADDAGNTALLLAASRGHVEVAGALLDAGAKPDVVNARGESPMRVAAFLGHEDVAALLAERGAAWDMVAAITMRNEQELAKLLSGGVDANAKLDPQGSTPLLLASSLGDESVGVVQLLLKRKADANAPNLQGGTPLLCASENGHAAVVAALLGAGADAAHADELGDTALCVASGAGGAAVVRLLCKQLCKQKGPHDRATLGAPGALGRPALVRAAAEGHAEVVQLLLGAKADANAADGYGATALAWAARGGHLEAVGALLGGGASANAVDEAGDMPLMAACAHGHQAVVARLLSAKADVLSANDDGCTPLLVACEVAQPPKANKSSDSKKAPPPPCRHDGVVRLLLDAKALPNAQNALGRSPLMYAALNSLREMVSLLLARGGDVRLKDADGEDALTLAEEAFEGTEELKESLAKAPQLGRRISCLDALVLEGSINSGRAEKLVMPTGGHGHGHGHGGAAAHQRKGAASPVRDDDADPEGAVGGRPRKLSLLEEEKAEAIGIINQQATNANDILEQVRRADAAASKVQWFWRFRGKGSLAEQSASARMVSSAFSGARRRTRHRARATAHAPTAHAPPRTHTHAARASPHPQSRRRRGVGVAPPSRGEGPPPPARCAQSRCRRRAPPSWTTTAGGSIGRRPSRSCRPRPSSACRCSTSWSSATPPPCPPAPAWRGLARVTWRGTAAHATSPASTLPQ